MQYYRKKVSLPVIAGDCTVKLVKVLMCTGSARDENEGSLGLVLEFGIEIERRLKARCWVGLRH